MNLRDLKDSIFHFPTTMVTGRVMAQRIWKFPEKKQAMKLTAFDAWLDLERSRIPGETRTQGGGNKFGFTIYQWPLEKTWRCTVFFRTDDGKQGKACCDDEWEIEAAELDEGIPEARPAAKKARL
jgi:hypothetical protein